MYCSNCGFKQISGARFCQSCGNSLGIAEASSSPPHLPPSPPQGFPKANAVGPNSDVVSIPWNEALSIWWSIAWRGFIFGLLGGFVLGFVGGFTAGAIGAPEYAEAWGVIGGYIASIPASMLAVKLAIPKHMARLARHVACA